MYDKPDYDPNLRFFFQDKSELALLQYKQWMTLASREIDQIRQELELLEKNLNCSDATLQLRTELTNLKNKVSVILYCQLPCQSRIRQNAFLTKNIRT